MARLQLNDELRTVFRGERGGDTRGAQGHLQAHRWNLGALGETKALLLLDARAEEVCPPSTIKAFPACRRGDVEERL